MEFRKYASGGGLMHSFDPQDRYQRLGTAAMVVAGPLANALGGAVALWLCALAGPPASLPTMITTSALSGFGFSMAFMAVVNLIPQRFGDGGTVASDGRQLLNLLRKRSDSNPDILRLAKVTGLIQMNRFDDAAKVALAVSDSSELRSLFFAQAIHCLSRSRGDAAAMDCYMSRMTGSLPSVGPNVLLDRDPLPWLEANVAWSALKSEDRRYRDLIEPMSAAALDAVPDAPDMKGTWGAWMVESGHADEGLPFLFQAVRAATDPIDRADFCIYLAKGSRAIGDEVQAEGFEQLRRHLLTTVV